MSGTLIVLGAYCRQFLALDDAINTLSSEWSPCHHSGTELGMNRLNALLLDECVALQLVDHRLDIYIVGKVKETARLEVAHADSAHLAGTISVLHGPPRAEYVTVGLMDKQQINVLCL